MEQPQQGEEEEPLRILLARQRSGKEYREHATAAPSSNKKQAVIEW